MFRTNQFSRTVQTRFSHFFTAQKFGDFLDALDKGGEPLVSGESGKKAVEIVLAIYESQKTGKAVELPSDFATNRMSSSDLSLKRKR